MRDQKQHVIISFCSLIIGSQVMDPVGSKVERVDGKDYVSENQSINRATSVIPAEVETAVAAHVKKKQGKGSLQPVIGKAIGTLLLAFLVWRIFGRKSRQPEQAE